jgi:hypothetical protein
MFIFNAPRRGGHLPVAPAGGHVEKKINFHLKLKFNYISMPLAGAGTCR